MKHLFLALLLISSTVQSHLMAQTVWIKDTNNPVLRRDTVVASLPDDFFVISDCWVIKEGQTYKMWYTAGGFNFPTDTLMRSRISYATSTDGITWEKYTGNPVMDVSYDGTWDSLGVETVSILLDEDAPTNERYKMWYAGQYFNEYRYDIGYAFSADGIHWTKHPNPVLQVGSASEWDNGFLEGPSVIKEAGVYKMWYCGYDAIPDGGNTDGKANLGYATSADGINWIKYAGNPILTTGTNSWDSIYVQDPHVLKEGNEYRMWYGGGSNDTYYDQQVGYATSSNGIDWVKSAMNPVLSRGNIGDWDEILSSFPSILNDNGTYKMWYTGRNLDPLPAGSTDYYWEIGYATGTTLGINEQPFTDQTAIWAYPNPAQNELTLTIHPQTPYEVVVTNVYGQVLMFTTGQLSLDISHLATGVYVLVINQGIHQYTQKFVKE